MRRYMREYRAARRKPPTEKPDPTKPTKELRRVDMAAYQRQYMVWWRANGPQNESLDPQGKDWWK